MRVLVKLCSCSRSYDAQAWADLLFVGRMSDDVDEITLRQCLCGSTIAIATFEDRAAVHIRDKRMRAHEAFALASLEIAAQRLGKACGHKIDMRTVQHRRAGAKSLLAEARFLEELLASTYKARELANPTTRLGRTLQIVDTIDAAAKTQRPASGTR